MNADRLHCGAASIQYEPRRNIPPVGRSIELGTSLWNAAAKAIVISQRGERTAGARQNMLQEKSY